MGRFDRYKRPDAWVAPIAGVAGVFEFGADPHSNHHDRFVYTGHQLVRHSTRN